MKIIFRVDGYKKIGYGHLVRCITLARQLIQKGQNVLFVSYKDRLVKKKLMYYSLKYVEAPYKAGTRSDLDFLIKLLKRNPHNICIYDSYAIHKNYEKKVLPYTDLLVGFDDEAIRKFAADVIINQNYGAEKYQYKLCNNNATVVAGIQYVLLREEILNNQKKQLRKNVHNILVIMGGSDPFCQTMRVVKVLTSNFSKINVHIVINSTHKDFLKLKEMSTKNNSLIIHSEVLEMGKLMKNMDLALSAGGSTVWELLYIGVPTLLFIVAQNQEKLVERLHKDGFVINLGWYNKVSDSMILNTCSTILENSKHRQLLFKKGQALLAHVKYNSIAKIIIQKGKQKNVS